MVACAVPACKHTVDVLRADHERSTAMIAASAEALDAVLHPSVSYTHSNGRVDSKESLIASLTSGRVDYRAIKTRKREVRSYGDTAIVTGPVRLEVAAGGQIHHLTSVYTAVYRWHENRWQLVAYQSSPAPPP